MINKRIKRMAAANRGLTKWGISAKLNFCTSIKISANLNICTFYYLPSQSRKTLANIFMRRLLLLLFLFNILSSCKNDLTSNLDDLTPSELQAKRQIKSIMIGESIWSAENLNVEIYRNGDSIKKCASETEWDSANHQHIGAYIIFENNETYHKKYGKLYNWYAVNDVRGLTPSGWHVATKEEWDSLVKLLGYSAGYKLKSKFGWEKYEYENISGNGDNYSGFNALPGGMFHNGYFSDLYKRGHWWTSSPLLDKNAFDRFISVSNKIGWVLGGRESGMSVRAVKDKKNLLTTPILNALRDTAHSRKTLKKQF